MAWAFSWSALPAQIIRTASRPLLKNAGSRPSRYGGSRSPAHRLTRRTIGVAFELACIALRAGDCADDVKQAIANKIIALAKAGERNPDVLCEQVLKDIRTEPPEEEYERKNVGMGAPLGT